MIRGICIVLRIDEVCLVWLESVLAECVGLLDPPLFRSQCFYFYAIENLSQFFMTRKCYAQN